MTKDMLLKWQTDLRAQYAQTSAALEQIQGALNLVAQMIDQEEAKEAKEREEAREAKEQDRIAFEKRYADAHNLTPDDLTTMGLHAEWIDGDKDHPQEGHWEMEGA